MLAAVAALAAVCGRRQRARTAVRAAAAVAAARKRQRVIAERNAPPSIAQLLGVQASTTDRGGANSGGEEGQLLLSGRSDDKATSTMWGLSETASTDDTSEPGLDWGVAYNERPV